MRDAAEGFQWTPQTLLFVQSYVLTGDTDKALADAQLPEDFKVEEFLAFEPVSEKLDELREAAIMVAMETEEVIIGRAINWAHADVADYFYFPPSTSGQEFTNLAGIRLKNIATMPDSMRKRVKALKVKPVVQQGMVITHTVEIELHDPMKANAEVAKLKKIGEEQTFSATQRAQQLYEFLQELEGIHNVRDGEFPPDDE